MKYCHEGSSDLSQVSFTKLVQSIYRGAWWYSHSGLFALFIWSKYLHTFLLFQCRTTLSPRGSVLLFLVSSHWASKTHHHPPVDTGGTGISSKWFLNISTWFPLFCWIGILSRWRHSICTSVLQWIQNNKRSSQCQRQQPKSAWNLPGWCVCPLTSVLTSTGNSKSVAGAENFTHKDKDVEFEANPTASESTYTLNWRK